MGTCCENRCLNTPHAWQMGWLNVRHLNGTSLPAAATYNTSMGVQAVSPNLSGIRIVPTWAPGVDPIFVGFRWAVRGDEFLPPSLTRRIHIYTSKISHYRDAQPTVLRASLRGGCGWLCRGLGVHISCAAPWPHQVPQLPIPPNASPWPPCVLPACCSG